jgi:3'-phosphoadenosine 5'-phosphosulfate sulfotransferase (PAPS reductase)/FAD synthetase
MVELVADFLSHCQQVINAVRVKSDRVLLFYSGGKDSIVMLDLIAPHFKEVVCVFMYFVKDLEHINRFLRYAQARYPNIRIMQVPHWNLSIIYKEGIYCNANPKIRRFVLKDVLVDVKERTGLKYAFFGMKKADSLNRRVMLGGYELEAINEKTGMVYPLSMWTNTDVKNYIKSKGLPKPIEYTNKKRSQGMGFDIDVFLFLQKNYPDDLQKIFRQFPLSEQLLFEHDYKQLKQTTTTND